MTQTSKDKLATSTQMIEKAMQMLIDVRDEEQDAFDELSERVQNSNVGRKIEDRIDCIFQILDKLGEAIDDIDNLYAWAGWGCS